MEASESDTMYYGGIDVQNAFYQHRLPLWLRPSFSLPGIQAHLVGVSSASGNPVRSDQVIYPQMAVVPYGMDLGLACCSDNA